MAKKNELNKMFDMLQGMSDAEKKNIVDRILGMMNETLVERVKTESCSDMVHKQLNGKPDCPHCRAKAKLGYIVKRGVRNGSQRYWCKSCGRVFVVTTNTAFERSRKDADTWRKFILLTIEGKSLADCAAKCKIAYQTAFTWRHKILNVFRVHQESVKMSGTVQMDEMLININYKGNHVKGPFHSKRIRKPGEDNGLPRKSYHRGSDNRSKSSKEKACVLCMVQDQGKKYYASVPGIGFMNSDMLDATVGKHIDKKRSKVLVDHYMVTAKYLLENQYSFETFVSNVSENRGEHKPEIRGNLHLQHINNTHRHIRRFLAGYCGVSSKYLENYISLFIWLKNIKASKQSKRLNNITITRAATSDCYISRKKLESYPAIPHCA